MSQPCPIHVLHVVSGDLWAGAEVQLFTLANTLQHQLKAKVSVVILNPGVLEQRLRNAGIEVIVLDESKLNGLQILYRLIKIIQHLRPDVIHTHRNKENILGSLAARWCGNIPSLRTAHGAAEHRPAWYHLAKRLIHFMDWFCGRYLQLRIIAVSDDLAGILEQDYPADRIVVINNGIDVTTLSHPAESPASGSAPAQAAFRIGIAGRLVPVKRVDLFIETARQLLNAHPEIHLSFHIFGEGPLRNELETLSHRQDMANRLIFEGHCEAMHNQLQSLDVLVMTSDHEGLPMVLLEAMALQTPIVAHAVGGIPDLLDQGNCGVLVHEHQPSAYAHAIYQLITATETRNAIIHNALNRVTRLYSAEQNAIACCKVYNELVQRNT